MEWCKGGRARSAPGIVAFPPDSLAMPVVPQEEEEEEYEEDEKDD